MSVEATEPRKGRPTKLTPYIIDAVVPIIRQGVPWLYSANAAGVTPKTLSTWLKRGEDVSDAIDNGDQQEEDLNEDDSLYLRFYTESSHAREQAIARNILYMQQSARGGYVTEKTTKRNRDGSVEETEKRTAPDWRAAAKFLQYAAPRDFGDKPQQVEMSGPGGGAIQVEDVSGIAARIAARQAALENTIDAEEVTENE